MGCYGTCGSCRWTQITVVDLIWKWISYRLHMFVPLFLTHRNKVAWTSFKLNGKTVVGICGSSMKIISHGHQVSNDMLILKIHDDVIKWQHFPRYWSFVGESIGDRWIPLTKPMTQSFDVFFDLHLNKLLSKQSGRRWFETPSRFLWRHCNINDVLCVTRLINIALAVADIVLYIIGLRG